MKLPVRPYSIGGRDSYSCGAVVLKMVVKHLRDKRLSHQEAVQITRCKPNGCDEIEMRKALRKMGLCCQKIYRKDTVITNCLDNDYLIVINDEYTYAPEDHWILIAGYTNSFYYIIDPANGRCFRRSKDKVISSSVASATIAVHKSPCFLN